jgi:sulfate adenylyltransferase
MVLPAPNGGVLINRELEGEVARQVAQRARELPRLHLDDSSVSDLLMIATGALSPLQGFLGEAEYDAVVETMRLPTGEVLGLPVTLPVRRHVAERLALGDELALIGVGEPLALLTVTSLYRRDWQREARLVYGTEDAAHPGVARVIAQGDWLLGGPVVMFRRPPLPFARYHKTPLELREAFARRGWQTVVGFQTRNPIHRAHEYIQKCALEIVDGLLLHPLVGETKPDDVAADVRLRSYEVMLRSYYPPERVLLAAFPAAMRYAGPREAVFHAICRRNCGCTHFIVGRDHAGVGNYYGTYDAQRIFANFTTAELGVEPLMFEHTFYCRACAQMSSSKTCPHSPAQHVSLSGTKVRAILQGGEAPPPEVTRPEVAAVLLAPREAAAASD